MKSLINAFKFAKLSGVTWKALIFELIPAIIGGINVSLFDSLINQMIGMMILEIMPMILHSLYGQIMDSKLFHTAPQRRELQINSNNAYYAFLVVVVKVLEIGILVTLFITGKMSAQNLSYIMINTSVTTVLFALFTVFLRKQGVLAFVTFMLEIPWFVFSLKCSTLLMQPLTIAIIIFILGAIIGCVVYGIITIVTYKMPLTSGYEQTT